MAELIALLDLGSNAVRLLLARIRPGVGFRVLRKERVQTRLGGGISGTLPRQAVAETLAAVEGFLGRLDTGRRPRVLAIATAAVREATNQESLLGALRRRHGAKVRILTGAQEARLGAVAALRTLPLRHGVIADLGGSSLQLTRLRKGRIRGTASLPLGAVRTTRRFLGHDPPTPRELRALRREVREHLAAGLAAGRRGDEMIGLGGTVRALASIHLRSYPGRRAFRQGLRLAQSDVTAIRERLESLPVRKRRRVRGLKAERADIMLAGALVIEELMLLGSYLQLKVCTRGVRDGLLLQETFDGMV